MVLGYMHGHFFILMQIEKSHKRTDGLLGDYCDGFVYQNHPLFVAKPNSLQIILYYDDLERANPLGSKSKIHKLGMHYMCWLCSYNRCLIIGVFYYTLGNIRPQYRSLLKCIQLVCIVNVNTLQEVGINTILSPFMKDIELLEQVRMIIWLPSHADIMNFV